jgi:hypothetical protein
MVRTILEQSVLSHAQYIVSRRFFFFFGGERRQCGQFLFVPFGVLVGWFFVIVRGTEDDCNVIVMATLIWAIVRSAVRCFPLLFDDRENWPHIDVDEFAIWFHFNGLSLDQLLSPEK